MSQHAKQHIGALLGPQISDLLEAKQYNDVRQSLQGLFAPEIADILIHLSPEMQPYLLRSVPDEMAADVFTCLAVEEQEPLVQALSSEQTQQIISEMDPDDRVDLIEDVPDALADRLLLLMKPSERAETERILEYPEESVGREMTPEFLTVRPEWTVQQALDHIRAHGQEVESLNYLYVIDELGRLVNIIRLRDLLVVNPLTICQSLQTRQVVSLNAYDDREAAVRVMERYDFSVLPVVDQQSVLVGVVTFDDVADVAEEEVTEDIQKLGGMTALEHAYLASSIRSLVGKRVGWLLLLFGGGLLTVWTMGTFQQSIEQLAALALFVPLVIASGGNSGSQAATLMIRSLALEEVMLVDWWHVLRRELLCGLTMGAILGCCGFGIGLLVKGLFLTEGDVVWASSVWFGLAVGGSLLSVVLMGTLTGAMLPFLLQKFGFDPATSSTPVVATIVDAAGLMIYFGMTHWLLV